MLQSNGTEDRQRQDGKDKDTDSNKDSNKEEGKEEEDTCCKAHRKEAAQHTHNTLQAGNT